IEKDGKFERLFLLQGPIQFPGTTPLPVTAAAKAASPAQAASGNVIKSTVDRRQVDQATSDLPKLLTQASGTLVINTAPGGMSGFRMNSISSSSFFEKIGLQAGDLLQKVNGVEVKDAGAMLNLFQQLRNENNVKVDLIRGGKPSTMSFEIR
ncbi:MAG: PDZ domain-containing protein, partial [Bdellovibrionota bacterium]